MHLLPTPPRHLEVYILGVGVDPLVLGVDTLEVVYLDHTLGVGVESALGVGVQSLSRARVALVVHATAQSCRERSERKC